MTEKPFAACPYCGSELTEGKLYFEGISGLGNAPSYVWGAFEDGNEKSVKTTLFGRKIKQQEKVSEKAMFAAKCPQCELYFAVMGKYRK